MIGKLFPNAITEVKRNGKVEHAIDFDVLRQELSDSIVEMCIRDSYSTMCIATQLWVSYKIRKAAPAPKKA